MLSHRHILHIPWFLSLYITSNLIIFLGGESTVAVLSRRVQAIVHFDHVLVVNRAAALGPRRLHRRRHLASTGAREVQVRRRVDGERGGVVEDTIVRLVVEAAVQAAVRGGIPRAHGVACLVRHEAEHVGANVPSAERVEPPVGLNGGDLAVVVVEVGVRGAVQVLGDSVAQQDGEHAVLDGVGRVLVKGDEDERVLHETGVVEQRGEEVPGPLAGDGDGGVVAVRGHVGRDEHPLRQAILLEILVEHGQVLQDTEAVGTGRVLVVNHRRVVLADVVVGAVLLIDPSVAFKARVRHVFLVFTPRNVLLLQEIDDGGNVGIDEVHLVIVHAKVIASVRGDIVGLRGVRLGEVVLEGDTLLSHPGQVR